MARARLSSAGSFEPHAGEVAGRRGGHAPVLVHLRRSFESFGLMGAKGAGAALYFVLQVRLTQRFGLAGLGVWSFGYSLVGLAQLIGSAGQMSAPLRFLGPGHPLTGAYVRYGRRRVARWSSLVGLALVGAGAIAALVGQREAGVIIALSGLVQVALSGLLAVQGVARATRPGIVSLLPYAVLLPLALVVLDVVGGPVAERIGPAGYLGFYGAIALVLAVVLACRVERSADTAEEGDARGWSRFGSAVVVQSISSSIFWQADLVVLGLLVGTEAVGTYSAASRLALVFALAPDAVAQASAPSIAKAFRSGDRAGIVRAHRHASALSVAVAAASLCVLAVALPFVARLFETSWRDLLPVLAPLIGVQLVRALAGPVESTVPLIGGEAWAARTGVVGGCCGVAAMVVGASVGGALGVAVATAVTWAGATSGLYFGYRSYTSPRVAVIGE